MRSPDLALRPESTVITARQGAGRLRSALLVAVLAATVAATMLLIGAGAAGAHTPHDSIGDVALSPTYAFDQTMFVVSGKHLLRSTDGGASWQTIVNGLAATNYSDVTFSPSDPQVMFVSSFDSGVYRSTDQGLSWETVNNGLGTLRISSVVVSPYSSNLVFASGTLSGLYRSVDGGDSWTSVPGFPRAPAVAFAPDVDGFVLIGDSSGAVSVSEDSGETWQQVLTTGGGTVNAVVASPGPSATFTVLAGTSDGRVFRSVDGAGTFAEVGGAAGEIVRSVALSTDYPSDQTAWLSTDQSLYGSQDGGISWSAQAEGLVKDIQADNVGVAHFGDLSVGSVPPAGQVLFLAGFDGLFRSDDGAQQWQPVETQTEFIVGLDVSPDYGEDSTVAVTTYVKGTYVSRDAGATWQDSNVGLGHPRLDAGNEFAPIRRLHNIVFSPAYATDDTIFSATWDRFLKSSDGGRSWDRIPVGPWPPTPLLRQFVIAVSPSYATDRTIYLGTRQGDIFQSTDGGGSQSGWAVLANVGSRVRSLVLSPSFSSDPVLYASTVNGVLRSDDAGATWAATGPSDLAQLAMSPTYDVDGTLFAGGPSGLSVTRDGGQTWTDFADAPLDGSSTIEAVAVSPGFDADGTVLVSVRGEGLLRSTDGGFTFAAVATDLIGDNHLIADFTNPTSAPIQFSPSFATDGTVYGYSGQEVVKSTDRGETWEVISLPPAARFLEPPVIEPRSAMVVEGGAGESSVVQVPIDLSHPSLSEVSVEWRTADVPGNPDVASAADGDYEPASGTLTFVPGETRRWAEIQVNGDDLDEADEVIVVATGNPTNATIGGFWGLGFGAIEDDDPLPRVVPSGASVLEGDDGSSTLSIPVSLSAPSGRTVTVEWTTLDVPGNPDVASSTTGDYQAGAGTLTFLPGETDKTIDVEVLGDTTLEGDEYLLVPTSSPVNARLGGFYGLGFGLIQNDD